MKATIMIGKCEIKLRDLAEASVDAIVTDPPYGLEFMGKDWDAPWKQTSGGFSSPGIGERQTNWPSYKGSNRNRCAICGLLIGQGGSPCKCEIPQPVLQDAGRMQAFQMWCEAWARECLRVLKPGGHLLSFGGSRTYHRMACAIEDAGFEIRDQIMWLYGSGFPKSLDVSKSIDKVAQVEREVVSTNKNHRAMSGVNYEGIYSGGNTGSATITVPTTDAAKQWDGWGTALKPAHEPIVVARKPLTGTVAANVLAHGTGALNIDGCRIPTEDKLAGGNNLDGVSREGKHEGWKRPWMEDEEAASAAAERSRQSTARSEALGRWPANVIHDGSEDVLDAFAGYGDKSSARASGNLNEPVHSSNGSGVAYEFGETGRVSNDYRDSGTAARFFYTAKADKAEREKGCYDLPDERCGMMEDDNYAIKTGSGNLRNTKRRNTHPTVKPIDLMSYLCRMVTPPGGTVLDPFTGSGSTGVAALREGFNFIGIEEKAEYAALAERRIKEAVPLFAEVVLQAGKE